MRLAAAGIPGISDQAAGLSPRSARYRSTADFSKWRFTPSLIGLNMNPNDDVMLYAKLHDGREIRVV